MRYKMFLFCIFSFFTYYTIAGEIVDPDNSVEIQSDLNDLTIKYRKAFLRNTVNNPSAYDDFKTAAIAYLDQGGCPNIILTRSPYYPTTLLQEAALLVTRYDDWALLKKMKEKKADFNFMSGHEYNQESILIHAFPREESKCPLALANFLLDCGADPTLMGASKISPIHFAARFFDTQMLKIFLEALKKQGKKANIKDADGNTPLLYLAKDSGAIYSWKYFRKKLEMLYEHGDDLKAKNNDGHNIYRLIKDSYIPYKDLKDVRENMRKWAKLKEILEQLQ